MVQLWVNEKLNYNKNPAQQKEIGHWKQLIEKGVNCVSCSLGFSARNPANKMFWVRAICKYNLWGHY